MKADQVPATLQAVRGLSSGVVRFFSWNYSDWSARICLRPANLLAGGKPEFLLMHPRR